jgi:hypothetical protein
MEGFIKIISPFNISSTGIATKSSPLLTKATSGFKDKSLLIT